MKRLPGAAGGVMLLLAFSATAATIHGKVVGISDGDTISVIAENKTTTKIRLSGIDAPEKSQAFGEQSKKHLNDQIFGKTVDIEWNKLDKYGRTIGKILYQGQDANLEQIKAGYAWHYKAYETEQSLEDRLQYAQAEKDAQSRKLGLWADSMQPIPPWEYRHDGRTMTKAAESKTASPCPCSREMNCTGPRGGQYCYTPKGNKQYR